MKAAALAGRALVIVLFVLAAGRAGADGKLYRLIDARLELMQDVAAHKWHHGLPIEDTEREAAVLARAVADALRYGFTAESSRAFFAAQIEAAKVIQRHWFGNWQQGGIPPAAPDLERVIRPELLRLGHAILAAAGRSSGEVSSGEFAAAVQVDGLDPAARAAVLESLERLERYPSRLQQILATGVLRVGTTGDYEPFSYQPRPDAAPEGIDIDMARRLADALGVRVAFVATAWPTLMDDLTAGRYDIAMGGVSRTVERQRLGYQSSPYYAGGKTPIARCDAQRAFDSLEAVDHSDVRVIVNPGGTNERFVDTHVHRARKVLHADNRTIFDALAAGEGDVMITDRVEVELQAARHPALCATMAEPLTYQEKAYLMPRDAPLREFVEVWLSLALADGTVATVFRNHGVEPRPPTTARTREP